jgi:hypothetical protein
MCIQAYVVDECCDAPLGIKDSNSQDLGEQWEAVSLHPEQFCLTFHREHWKPVRNFENASRCEITCLDVIRHSQGRANLQQTRDKKDLQEKFQGLIFLMDQNDQIEKERWNTSRTARENPDFKSS